MGLGPGLGLWADVRSQTMMALFIIYKLNAPVYELVTALAMIKAHTHTYLLDSCQQLKNVREITFVYYNIAGICRSVCAAVRAGRPRAG